MADALLGFAFEKLMSLLQNEFSTIVGIRSKAEKLSTTLYLIKAVLEDAEKKQLTNSSIKVWLQQLKDAVYMLNDILDECSIQSNRLKGLSALKPKNIMFRHDIGKRLNDIIRRFDDIAESKNKFLLQERVTAKEMTVELAEWRQTSTIQRRNRDESEIESINQIVGIVSRNLHHVGLPNATWQKLFNADNIWRLVGLVSSVVGISCYALSPSFNRLIGTRKPFKFILYGVLSLALFTTILFVKKSPSSTRHDQLKIYTSFAVLMIISVYTFFYDRAVNGKPDILNVVSNAAFVLVSLSLHKLVNFGFEIGVFSYFLGCFAVQLFTINWMLILIAILFGCPLFVMHSSLNAQPEVVVDSDDQHIVDIDS